MVAGLCLLLEISFMLSSYHRYRLHHNTHVFLSTDVPDAPKKLQPSEVTRSAVTLTWEPPESDGGSVITGYIVERKSPTTSRWVRVNKSPVRDTVYTVADLAEGMEYEFRVLAENAAGISKPSQPTGIIKAVDPYSKSSLFFLPLFVFVCLFSWFRWEFTFESPFPLSRVNTDGWDFVIRFP